MARSSSDRAVDVRIRAIKEAFSEGLRGHCAPMKRPAALIGIDWGTTSFRAWRIDASGHVLEARSGAAGILKVPGGAFEAALEREIGDWLGARPPAVIASGMITSRQGWLEVPYRPCPAGRGEIAAGLVHHRTGKGREIHFV